MDANLTPESRSDASGHSASAPIRMEMAANANEQQTAVDFTHLSISRDPVGPARILTLPPFIVANR